MLLCMLAYDASSLARIVYCTCVVLQKQEMLKKQSMNHLSFRIYGEKWHYYIQTVYNLV